MIIFKCVTDVDNASPNCDSEKRMLLKFGHLCLALIAFSLWFPASLLAQTKAHKSNATEAPAGYPSVWTQSQAENPCEMVQSGEATEAFNFMQTTRTAAADYKAIQEGRPFVERPHVDKVWYDSATQLFHWQGPATGKEMSMGRKQFMKEIWFPYFYWLWLHTSF